MKLTHLLPAAFTALIFAACGSGGSKDGIALKGTVATDSINDFTLSYNLDGDIQNYRVVELSRDDKGNFQVPDSVLPAEGTHATIAIDNTGYFGVWLQPGKTAVMDIAGTPSQGLTATFSGDNADINDLYNDLTVSYDIMIYTPQDPSDARPKEELMTRLNNDRQRLNAKVQSLSDPARKEYYAILAEQLSDRMEGFVLEDEAYASDSEPMDNPAYRALIEKVDPNLDQSLESAMVYLWLRGAAKDLDPATVEGNIGRLKLINEKITNKRTRKALYNSVPNTFFAYMKPSPEDAAKFMDAYGEIAKDYPELIDKYTLVAQNIKEVNVGDAITYNPQLISIDGKTCKLSDLYGKVLYVDFWATWCGPCCKQIPHLEKLVEKMKDVKGLEFVSISCDTDTDAWKAKVAKDNPQWPQYIFAGDDGDKFMASLNITGIPRFMVIGPDGKLILPEAPMPSDPKTEQTLLGLLK